ncbi:MAG: DUF952 domain-containing protein [Pseudomonadales bacterium]|nr:DUF952 domain-containing protein [Pseudomonadales bacterium]
MSAAERLLHVAERAEYEACLGGTHYAPSGYDVEGFIHLCRPVQLAGVLERYYRDREDLLLLVLETEAFDAELVFEDTTGRGERFPHLRGAVPLAAVRAVRGIRTDGAGRVSAGAPAPGRSGGRSDHEALGQAAFILAEQCRDGVFAHVGKLPDAGFAAWLHAELAQRCPGFSDEEYASALGEGFLASR